MSRRTPAPRANVILRSGLAVAAALLGGCALLPGGGSTEPEDPSCWIGVRNEVAWGVQVSVFAPDGRPPLVFQRDIGYFEREGERVVEIPCVYRSALVRASVRRVSGLPGMQRTRFRLGLCLIPGDTVPAVLDEYGDWDERWFEACPDLDEADGGFAVRPTRAADGDAPEWAEAVQGRAP